MHNLFKNPKEEQSLETPKLVEVVNAKSDYFGESFYLTHKAEIKGETWYKAVPEYYVKGVDSLWFNVNELEFENGESHE